MRSLDHLLAGATRALVIGIGGGGDAVGALAVARLCQTLGTDFALGGVSWERRPIDPRPGPRRLDEILGGRPLSRCCALADAGTTTIDGIPFTESHLASHLCTRTVLVDPTGGPAGVADGLVEAAGRLGCDLLCLVDIGGDVLADGSEPGLASPLCDAVMLAAGGLAAARIPTALFVAGLGCDSELTHAECLAHAARLAEAGAWLGTWGLGPDVATQIELAAAPTGTEASLNMARCFRGEHGPRPMRGGRRTVELGPLGAMILAFAVPAAATLCPLAALVADAADLEDAHARLAAQGLRTELAYERDPPAPPA